MRYLLVLDQGSTSSRAVLYNRAGRIAYLARTPLPSLRPAADRVEHDPDLLLNGQLAAMRKALQWLGKNGAKKIAALGVTNQRSTFLLWDRRTGRPVGRAISWQDRRGADACRRMTRHLAAIRAATGLRLTPHSTIGKLRWLLRDRQIRRRAEAGDLLFGTVNTYLIWRLTDGALHATDDTNASRTLMMNLRTRAWDPAQLARFDIPPALLPVIRPTAGWYGDAMLGGRSVPILSSIGDQQASLVGQGGYRPGHLAVTYGTGGFLLWNIGAAPQKRTTLLSTIAWSSQHGVHYALEGTVNAVGSAIHWLRDRAALIRRPEEIDPLNRASRHDMICLPSIAGLGSPYYAPIETTLYGLDRGATRADVVRGALAAIAWLVKDNYTQMCRERNQRPRIITAGGGAAQSRALLQLQADLLGREIGLSNVHETTSRGAAYLAGLECGFWSGLNSLDRLSRSAARYRPAMPARKVKQLERLWRQALTLAMERATN